MDESVPRSASTGSTHSVTFDLFLADNRDINSWLESTINIVWNELKYKATVRKEYGDIPQTKCNLGQLNQVFMNILVNAAHVNSEVGKSSTFTVKISVVER